MGNAEAEALVAERALGIWRARPPRALEEARKALVDALAVAAAAYRVEPTARGYVDSLVAWSAGARGSSTVLGLWRKVPAHVALEANSFLAHSIEYDDWLRPGYVHAGCTVVPTALAVAEERGSPLGDLVAAIAAGYEAAALVGAYMGREHYSVWHTTATAGSAGAAVAAALLMGGEEQQVIAGAVGLALSYAGGLWAAARDPRVKPFSASNASWLGYRAATLSVTGYGVEEALNKACRAMGGACDRSVLEDPPWDWAILHNGYKFYPTCRHSHTAIDAALEVHERLQATPDSIEAARVEVFHEAVRVAGRRGPRDVYEARFSISHLVAAALVYGSLGLEELKRSLSDPRIERLRSLVELVENPSYTSLYPTLQPAKVTVILASGELIEAYRDRPRGDPGVGSSISDILSKARELLSYAGDPRGLAVIERLAEASLGEEIGDIIA